MAIEDGRMFQFDNEKRKKLIKDRRKSFEKMMEDISKEGYQIENIRTESGFTARLAIKQPHEEIRGMLILCAGGGFLFKSWNEAYPVAEFFYKRGINVAILDYHVNESNAININSEATRMAGEDGLMAIRYLRFNASKFNISPKHIAIGGFSAGGILSGYAATKFDYGLEKSENALMKVSSRPDAALILYGAFSVTNSIPGSTFGMTREEIAQANELDNVRNIRVDSPPMFVFQTHEDDPRIALNFCYELAVHGVPYEIHTFESGIHGGGLYNGKDGTPDVPHTAMWADIAVDWLLCKGF